MMRKGFEIFVFLFIPGVLSQRGLNSLESMIVDEGQIAYMPCEMLNRTESQKAECNWFWNGVPIPMISYKYFFDKISEDGNCGIIVFAAQLDKDDGLWKCEIKMQNNTLLSRIIKLVVAEVPSPPSIRYGENNEFKFEAGQPYLLECQSPRSNPPTILKWFLNGQEILRGANQTNLRDYENPNSWVATSVLNFAFQPKDFNKTLECVSEHKGHETRIQRASIVPDILYEPQLRGISMNLPKEHDIVEGTSLVLKCVVDANPPATIFWTRPNEVFNFDDEELILDPVLREDSGAYTCYATNSLGRSENTSKTIDVKYGKSIPFQTSILPAKPLPDEYTSVTPKIQLAEILPWNKAINLYHPVTFICRAEGNPSPSYSWRKKVRLNSNEWREKSAMSTLHFEKAEYISQGVYICVVSNTINGKKSTHKSREISVDVVGRPQIIKKRSNSAVKVNRGQKAIISVNFCADPQPYVTYWILSNGRILATNATYTRYSASEIKPSGEHGDCYDARLNLENSKHRDSGGISFVVTNFNGTAKHGAMLTVKGLDIDVIVAITVTAGLLAVLLVGFAVCQLKRKEQNAPPPAGSDETSSRAQFLRPADDMNLEKCGH